MQLKKFKIGHIAKSFLLAAGVCALAFAIGRSSPVSDFELWGYDFLVNHAGYAPAAKDLVFVDFDDATVSALNEFPIPRRTIAQVISKVSAAKPRVIALDVFLSEPRGPQEDAEMQKALTEAGNVIVASQLGTRDLPAVNPLPIFCQPDTTAGGAGFCREGSPGAMGFAFVNMPIDRDGFIRSMLLLPTYSGGPVSFPLALAQQFSEEGIYAGNAGSAVFLKREIPFLDRDSKTALIGRWSPEPAKRISALDVLTGKVALSEMMNDKLVLIGQGSDAARDRHFTPIFRSTHRGSQALISGTQVLAAGIATLLEGPAISILPARTSWLVIFLCVWLLTFLTLRLPLRFGISIVVLAILGFYAGAQLLFAVWHTWMKFMIGELSLALSLPVSMSYQYMQERFRSKAAMAERQQIMQLFSRYVSAEVASEIWERRSELSLAGEERSATVLFSDIRSFTQLTAGKPSATVLAWLNRYFTAMDEVIREEGGFLNKFIGDGLMVLFGVPLSDGTEADAWRAVRCGVRMLQRVEKLNRDNRSDPNYLPIHIGVGIHTGTLTCGNVGSQARLEYSVIGETVNLASRLESLTKDYHTPLVMSAATYEAVRKHVKHVRDLGPATVRGFDCPIQIYTLDVKGVKFSTNDVPASQEGVNK